MDLNSLTEAVIGAAFEVSNTLGAGFLEKLYERALVKELAFRGIAAVTQVSDAVTCKGQLIGEFQPDLVVENILIVELKCVDRFTPHIWPMPELPAGIRPRFSVAAQLPASKSGLPPSRSLAVAICVHL